MPNQSVLRDIHVYDLGNSFNSYITGLIEGDGTIIIPTKERNYKGKLLYPSIEISFHASDYPLAQAILKQLGQGSLNKKPKAAAYILTVNSNEGILFLVTLLNGNFRGPKYYRFKAFIEYLNANHPNLNLVCLPLDVSSLNSNAWFAGFMEADASFQVRATVERVAMSWELTQARTTKFGYSNYDLILNIANFLGVSVNPIRSDRFNPQYRVRTSTVKSHLILSQYLVKFPLQSTKQLNFKAWESLISYFQTGTHSSNLVAFTKVKSSINNNRTEFNWNHLIIGLFK